MELSLGFLSAFLAVSSFYVGWRWRPVKLYTKLIGSLALVIAIFSFAAARGIEFGIIYFTISVALSAFVMVLVESKGWRMKPRPPRAGWSSTTPTTIFSNLRMFFFSVLLAGLVSMLGMVIVSGWLPLHGVNRAALGVILLPLVWGGLMFWGLLSAKTFIRSVIGLLVFFSCVLLVS